MNENSIDTTKYTKGKVKHTHMVDLDISFSNAQQKIQNIKHVNRLVTIPEFLEKNVEKERYTDRSNNQSARFTGTKKNTSVNLVVDDSEVLESTQRGHNIDGFHI